MKVTLLGIDLAKTVFQLHGVDALGKAVLRKRLVRDELARFVANLPACIIAMEACAGAHHWARKFQQQGHEVKLISPQFVKPFVKTNKNDAADAEAICEAASRPSMRFVPVKSVAHQDIQGLHRVRERLVRAKTALANEIRGLLQERGIVLPQSVKRLRSELPKVLAESKGELTPLTLRTLENLMDELDGLIGRIKWFDIQVLEIHESDPRSQKIGEIPGFGPLISTALIAAMGDPKAFRNGRQLSAWLGLVPRQASSGGKEKLLGISKRGDVYLRKLMIHGARSALRWMDKRQDSTSTWARQLVERRGMNRATVALANKNARVAWVILAKGRSYEPRKQTAA